MKRILPGAFFLGLGFVGLLSAFKVNQREMTFRATAVKATGEVVALIETNSRDTTQDSTPTYAPKVEFADAMGHSITFVSSVSTNPPSYHTGDKVPVLYQPGTPQKAQIDSWFSRWGSVAIVGGISGLFALIGAAAFFIR